MNKKIGQTKHVLKRFYEENGNERCGFVLQHYGIHEVPNICENPDKGFLINTLDIRKYIESGAAIATWHTHPNKDSNLSGEDYRCFRAYPNVFHYIIGNDGVRCFKFDKDKQVILEVN